MGLRTRDFIIRKRLLGGPGSPSQPGVWKREGRAGRIIATIWIIRRSEHEKLLNESKEKAPIFDQLTYCVEGRTCSRAHTHTHKVDETAPAIVCYSSFVVFFQYAT